MICAVVADGGALFLLMWVILVISTPLDFRLRLVLALLWIPTIFLAALFSADKAMCWGGIGRITGAPLRLNKDCFMVHSSSFLQVVEEKESQ
jgi:hypothetical protein